MLGRYEIVTELGSGAAGDVFLVRDRLLDGRELALKRLRAEVDDSLRRAFEREFSTMASLSVPGVAQVFDFGVIPAEPGTPARSFYTRSYIAGLPLDRAALTASPRSRLTMFRRMAEVIAPLHRAGVVHGDIKPGNAIFDAQGQAHVIDFGLARVLGQQRHDDDHASGTIPFMAPELFRGEPPTRSSDVYALGVTLWWLLAGELPFGRRGALSPGYGKALAIPDTLDESTRAAMAVAQRTLAPDPLDRLPSVDELIVALDAAVPELRTEAHARLFVPPRPQGQDDALARAQAYATDSGRASGARSLVLEGPLGSGKSRLLRELKWRMQLRGAAVLEASCATDEASLLRTLARQAELTRPGAYEATQASTRLMAALEGGPEARKGLADAWADALGALCERGSVVLLLDDLDRAEASFGALLRSAVFAEPGRNIAVIATASNEAAAAVRALAPDERIGVPALSRTEIDALVLAALGPVDATVLDALAEQSQGLPGALLDGAAALFPLAAPTANDVRALPARGAGRALAETRLAAVSPAARELLEWLAVLEAGSSLPMLRALAAKLGGASDEVDSLLARCEAAGLVARRAEGIVLANASIEHVLLEALGEAGTRALAARMLALGELPGLGALQRARLAVVAEDPEPIRELAPPAARELVARGAHAAAASLYEALHDVLEGAARDEAALELARCKHALGDLPRAAALAASVAASAELSAELRTEAAIVHARALTAQGRFDEAVQALSLVPAEAAPEARGRALRELAKVHQRRGDYAASTAAAEAGLQVAMDPLVRVELLCSRGMAASYRAEHEAARTDLEAAVALARQAGSARDEATARATLAVARFRISDILGARDELTQCLEIARSLGDIGSMANFALNVGVLLFYLGEPASAAEHYERASKLAQRAGRSTTDAQARNNLAHVHIYFGLYERAKQEVQAVLAHAQRAGQKYIEAQGTALLGDLAARAGDVEKALIQYDQAIGRYAELGQSREVAEHHLDAAEALLDRGGPADASAAAARLAAARTPIEEQGLLDLRLRHALLLGRARVASADAEAAVTALERVLEQARAQRSRDVEWSALSALAVAHESLGAELAARRHHRLAAEVLEDISLRVPREHREAFWHDPRRRAVRQRALAAVEGPQASSGGGDVSALLADPRAERLLEIIKRLAAEHDLDRLLERITESAVDLSSAERGFVLLVDAHGQLEKRTVQVSKSAEPDPHEAFSRSIAEAVLIDAQPIVTVDATRDGRLSEYVSVHKLMLRSVACLPIRTRDATVGVLYLEHRRSRGRFSDAAVELLQAFADQAAIALENARLISENRRRQAELEALNAQLLHAKQDLEELLVARTDALTEAQRELSRARTDARAAATRHGMVGRSEPMQRVFDAIDRLQGSGVPVVIVGESGTGKELVARAIHYGGARAREPFVALNCGSLPEGLLESELFGHVRGAFSGADREKRGLIARASGGTLFLDEIGDMPAKMQIDLLRVLQERKVCKLGSDEEEAIDVRVLCASHQRLEDLVKRGRFREDLYYRLNVVELALPPLRARREDIALLAEHVLEGLAQRDGKPIKRLAKDALERLLAHPLPGNVRQLEHLLVQAYVMSDGARIEASDLALDAPVYAAAVSASTAPAAQPGGHAALAEAPLPQNLEDHRQDERSRILRALEANGWNRARAARSLGVPRRTFYRRLQEYQILVNDDAQDEASA